MQNELFDTIWDAAQQMGFVAENFSWLNLKSGDLVRSHRAFIDAVVEYAFNKYILSYLNQENELTQGFTDNTCEHWKRVFTKMPQDVLITYLSSCYLHQNCEWKRARNVR